MFNIKDATILKVIKHEKSALIQVEFTQDGDQFKTRLWLVTFDLNSANVGQSINCMGKIRNSLNPKSGNYELRLLISKIY